MRRLLGTMVTAVVAVLALAPRPAVADAGVSVWIGDPCCYPHHHSHYDGPHYDGPHYGWGRPVYVMPPPMIVGPPPVVYGQPAVAWVPPGTVQASPASPDFVDGAGRTCREYQSTVMVGGVPRPSYGKACLMADGSWRIMN